jgi:hypothetical protein
VTPERPLGGLSRVLAATVVYNPIIRVKCQYRSLGPYTLDELKEAFAAAIAADDDSLTQFHEAEELLARLRRAASFADVVAIFGLAHTESEDD